MQFVLMALLDFTRGSGDGEKKWIVHLMGGAWCFVAKTYLGSLDIGHMGCYERSKSTWTGQTYMIGSSKNNYDGC